MRDPFEASEIPDDPEYWTSLAEHVAASAVRASKQGTLDWLAARRARWLAASVLLVALVALSFDRAVTGPPDSRAAWIQALSPRDTLGQAMRLSDNPPAIAALLLASQIKPSK